MTAPLTVQDLDFGRRPVSFTVGRGEVLAVLGDNGSGKSLMMAHLSGHLRARQGSVRVGDRALLQARREVGVVFQHHGLIRNMTVFENVALPFLVQALDLDGALAEKVRLRLRLVGCAHLENEDVHRLSEGDKRCVALARALAGTPQVLLADEPSAALAPAKKALVEELLATLSQTGVLAAVVLATQDLDFARRVATHFLLLHPDGPVHLRREDALADERCAAFLTRTA
jgi:ABC-type sulfate/molybdate transport systems ATPase subunit